ncbi:hypothetical protein KC316_g1793 [Hortaea werneckii]|nr:hypothetical protein KC324_g870 [Hortaea werneckii]KAI7593345.1 hypothetical protein KC316_g1793 [Hortaea werneckii]
MDPGTALGVASLAYDVTRDLYEYYRAWKHCDSDVKDLRVQLLWLNDAFRVCRDVVGKPGLSADGTQLVLKALASCDEATNSLRGVLDKIKKDGSPQGAVERLKASTRKACYPFRKKTVGEIADEVESCRGELNLAVNLLHLDTSMERWRELQELDKKLADGQDAIDAALKPLPRIQSSVEALRAETQTIVETQRSEDARKTVQEVMEWLCSEDYSKQQNDNYARRQEGTAAWFLDAPEYLAWVQGSTHTLVCPGQPGAGKTIVAATIIHKLLHREDVANVGVAYLFCDYKKRDQQDTYHFLAALTRQLLFRVETVPRSLMDVYVGHKKRNTRPTLRELKDALSSLAGALTRVHIVIDALDECNKEACSGFLPTIRELQVQRNISLLITARPLREVLDHVPSCPTLEVRASEHDVAIYLRARMQTLPNFVQADPDLQERIVTAVVSAVDGMFLLAQLHMDSLGKCLKKKQIREALATLPRGSDPSVYAKVYSDAMVRIRSQEREHSALAEEALSWVVRARRPLRSQEFRHGLAVELDSEMCDCGEEDLHDIDLIIALCAGLIAVHEQSGTIRLVHYTAQKFFEDSWQRWSPSAESTIAMKCLKYLSLQPLRIGPCGNDELDVRLYTYPLLDYSAKYWAIHADGSTEDDRVTDAALSFLRNEKYATNHTEGIQGLHLIGRFGTSALAIRLLEAGFPAECRDSRGMTPLSYAAQYGHKAVVRLLLDTKQVKVDSKDHYGQTPLSQAVDGGHEAVVKLLLDTKQVEVDSKDKYGETPLSRAAGYGNEAVVKLLLDTKQVEVDTKDKDGQTPLSRAADSGHEAVVKLLLDTKQVEVDSKDKYSRTPLSWAADSGDEVVVKLLLDTKQVEVDSKDNNGQTPLSWAAGLGHEAIVKLLLDTQQVEVNTKDNNGRTPLWWAAKGGNEAVVKLLLDTKQVQVDSKDNYGQTPLSRAADSGHEAVVKLLLDTQQVEVDAKDRNSETPLSRAADSGHEAVVKLLLNTKQVEVDSKDKYGQTPLSWAAISRHEAVVKLLLDTKQVEVDAKDNNGRTPLWWAVNSGNEAVVKLLLDTKQVKVDSKDKDGQTPLWWAADSGHEAVVKLLLDTKQVEVDSKDNNGRTPLSQAVDGGHEAVVKLLLDTKQVEVDSKDNNGRTPLWWAADSGHEAVVKLLLDTKQVEVDAKDNYGRTPLSRAAKGGHEAVVKLLLDTRQVEVTSKDLR